VLQDPNKNSVRCEASRHFRNKKDEYLIANIDELKTNCMIKDIRYFYRSIDDFKTGY